MALLNIAYCENARVSKLYYMCALNYSYLPLRKFIGCVKTSAGRSSSSSVATDGVIFTGLAF